MHTLVCILALSNIEASNRAYTQQTGSATIQTAAPGSLVAVGWWRSRRAFTELDGEWIAKLTHSLTLRASVRAAGRGPPRSPHDAWSILQPHSTCRVGEKRIEIFLVCPIFCTNYGLVVSNTHKYEGNERTSFKTPPVPAVKKFSCWWPNFLIERKNELLRVDIINTAVFFMKLRRLEKSFRLDGRGNRHNFPVS